MRVIEPKPATEEVRDTSVSPTMKMTEKKIDKSRRSCPLSQKIVEMLVKQMSAELSNHNLYRTFANYFNLQGLPKLETYYLARAEEEYKHHDWIYKYLATNDAEYQYPTVEAINVDINNRIMPFLATVDREIETTMDINKIVDQAKEEGDWATFNWLNGDDEDGGMLVKEQVEYLTA